MKLDLYEILQVSPNAEPEVIEAAYRRLARKYHPDVNPSPDAAARMKEINWAYEILSDPQKRAMHDAQRRFVRTGPYEYPPSPRPARPSYQPPKEPQPSSPPGRMVPLARPLGAILAVLVLISCVASFLILPGRAFPSFEPTSYPTSSSYPTDTARPAVALTPTPLASWMSPTPTETPTSTSVPPASPFPSRGQETYYIVEFGDTLASIAERFDTTVEALIFANGLTSPYVISVGQELMIPGEGVVLPSPTKPTLSPASPTASPLPTQTPTQANGIMQVTTELGTTWDVKVTSVEKETVLKSTFSSDVTYAAGEYWILTLEVINRGRRTDSFIVVDLALQARAGGAVYEEDNIATLYVEAARDMGLAAWKINPGEAGRAVKVFDVPLGTTELILTSQEILSRSEGTIVVRP